MNTATDNNYDDEFTHLASLPDDPAELKAPATEPEDPPADDPPAADPPADDPPADDPPADDPPAEDPPAEDPPAEDPPADDPPTEDADQLIQRLSSLLNERGERQPAPRPEPKVEVEPDQPPLYTQDEQDIIDTYRNDWPDISKAEQLVRRAEYRNIVAYVFDQISAELRPLMETVGAVAERTHLGDLNERVPDYGDVRDKVVGWVETQPAYLQDAYNRVIQEGTVDEVTDLIERYRQANPPARAAAQPVKPEPELPSNARKAVKSLAPVSSKRSVVPTGGDPDDFESAFEKFAGKL